MDKVPLIRFIEAHTPHVAVGKSVLLTIAEQFEEKALAKHDFLLKEGKVSGYFYLHVGLLRAFTHDLEGNEVTTYFYAQNRVVFDASSFFLNIPSSENIQAVTDCQGYYTTFDKLNILFHTVPAFREFGRAMLVKEFVAYKQRTLAMINQSAETRYETLMRTHPEIFQYVSLKHIASYLGISERSLSRIRNEFAKK